MKNPPSHTFPSPGNASDHTSASPERGKRRAGSPWSQSDTLSQPDTPAGLTMRARDWGIDVLVAAVAYLFGVGQLLLTASSIYIQDVAFRQLLGTVSVMPTDEVYVALAVTTVPLVFRRRFPWPVFVFCLASFLVLQYNLAGLSFTVIGPAIALYTVADERGVRQGVAAAAVAVLGLLFIVPTDGVTNVAFFTRFQNVAFVLVAVVAGYAARTHRAYVQATEERAAEAERTREEEAARRVEEERVRIAREVHDITAHSLSAVAVQAAAAERLIDRNPEAAREAIATVRATAKGSLDDIRSMIGVLRHGDDPVETMPTSGTERMLDLVEYLDDAGIACTFTDEGYDRALVPAHIDMGLFGIAREACTNMVKHSRATQARMLLALRGQAAELTIEDNGRGSGVAALDAALPQSADGAGHGIQGMAERVRLLGGTFEAGDTGNPDNAGNLGAAAEPEATTGSMSGGFRIRVVIPLKGAE